MIQKLSVYKLTRSILSRLNRFSLPTYFSIFFILISSSLTSLAQSTTTINPLISNAIFKNPERGFHNYTTLATTLDEHKADVTAGSTLALLVLNDLGPFMNSAISSAYLDKLKNKFTQGRSAKLKFIIIPSYHVNANFNSDPSINTIKNHIAQLAPVFNANKDVIYAIHAGFIGAWGEWYYTQHSFSAKSEIFMELLNKTDPKIKVSIRTPAYKIGFFDMTAPGVANINAAQAKRVGHFNDCFLADSSDMGTGDGFSLAGDWRDFIGGEAKSVPVTVGGETCQVSTYSVCSNALSQMARQGFSYINIDYNPDVIQQWKTGGCFNTINRKLGYRFAVKSVTIPTAVKFNAKASFNFSIENSGYAPLIHQRPVKLVLYNANGAYTFNLNKNPTMWKPGLNSFTANIDLATVSMVPGNYNVALFLPDASSSLANNPSYAVQFANVGTWNATKGWNVIKDGSSAVIINITN